MAAGSSTGSLDFTKMASQQEQFHELARVERLRTLRNWCLYLGVGALIASLSTAGIVGLGNPESSTSLYLGMAGEGFFRWMVIPLLAASLALFIVGALLHGLAARRHGEV